MAGSIRMGEVILDQARHLQPDMIVNLGDTLDRHESIHSHALLAATRWIVDLSKIAPTYVLIGNHDRPNNSDFLSEEHPFVGLKEADPSRLRIVDRVVVARHHGHNFFMVPYVPPGRFSQALETYPIDLTIPWTAGFTHQEFYGLHLGHGIVSTTGDAWDRSGPLLINGHIHDRHIPQPNIISIGTPRQHAFGEDPDKAISIFEFTSPGVYTETRLSLNIPKKLILRMDVPTFLEWTRPPQCQDELKIEVEGSRADLTSLRHIDKVSILRKDGIKVVTRDVDLHLHRPAPIPKTESISFRRRLAYRLTDEDVDVRDAYAQLFSTRPVIHPRRPASTPSGPGSRRIVIRKK